MSADLLEPSVNLLFDAIRENVCAKTFNVGFVDDHAEAGWLPDRKYAGAELRRKQASPLMGVAPGGCRGGLMIRISDLKQG